MPRRPDDAILEKLDEIDNWPGLIKKMMAYAVWLAKVEYKWRVGTVLPKGNEIKDLVYSVVIKLYSGERTWDPDKVPLEIWLRNNVRSEMNNLFRSAYTGSGELREVPLESDRAADDDEEAEYVDVEGGIFERASDDPEAALVEKESRAQRKQMIDAVYKAIEGDELLEQIYYEILGGRERKPRVLAEKLGATTEDINNALRRLDRRVERIAAEWLGGENE
jgi:hypothetical protein